MAYRRKKKGFTGYGKPFQKKGGKGKFRKGTKIQYQYKNGRRVRAVAYRRGRR